MSIFVLFFVFAVPELSALTDSSKELLEESALEDLHEHNLWNELLHKHVSIEGHVDYKGFKKDQNQLETYLDLLESNPPQDFWTRHQKLAYWINVYNAFTIKLIVDHYPVSSIMDIFDGKPWQRSWIKLGDNTYSLDEIENEIIRPEFDEPRIHFVLNCAARSCPPLANKAITEKNMDDMLDHRTRAFIGSSQFNEISENKLVLSRIFEWYAVDFHNIPHFIKKYSGLHIDKDATITYKDYDWSLNE